jgi:ribosomal protein L7/L12
LTPGAGVTSEPLDAVRLSKGEFSGFSPREVVDALQRGQKIQAIQHYRKATGVGLKKAKDFIEDAQRRAGDAS